MPVITAQQLKPSYDVVVVGSGAAGGQMAYTLTMAGVSVLMLEAGRNYEPATETPMFQIPGQAPLRAASTPDKPRGFYNATVDGGWNVAGEPYSNASSRPNETFNWWRARMLGGRTNHWERNAFRFGPYDFKPYSRDGLGVDWPIAYEDLAPYYDRVERLVGVFGESEGLENSPDSPAGILLPPPRPRIGELLAQQRAKTLGIPIVPIHRAVLTKRLDSRAIPSLLHPDNPEAQKILSSAMDLRAPCFWATPCERGCSIKANYQSCTVHLPPAMATGKLDLLPHARAREVETDAGGKAKGLIFIDTLDAAEHRVKARVVVLAASSFESVRLLLNSNSHLFPNGLGNSGGLVGRHILNTVGHSVAAQIPRLENLPLHNEDGAGGAHVYAPWWLYQEQRAGKLNFPRGYHVEFVTGRQMPSIGTVADLHWRMENSYGRKYKEEVRRFYGSQVSFVGRGEMIPNDQTFCEIDPDLKDQWGVPALKFHWKWSEHEIRQAEHMHSTFSALLEAMGGVVRKRKGQGITLPSITHEVGGAKMGSDRKTSVTSPWGNLWEVPNLFVADGATFCSSPDKNPTLTIMALAWRSADFILEKMKQGSL